MTPLEVVQAAFARANEPDRAPLPLMIPPALAERVEAELGALPEGIEVAKPIPEPTHIVCIGGGRINGIAIRGTVTITLHDAMPADGQIEASVDVERGVVTIGGYEGELTLSAEVARMVRVIGRSDYADAAKYGAGHDLMPLAREPRRKALWKSERNGRRRT